MFHGALGTNVPYPAPKNPVIAGVFAQVGLADELGSGLRAIQRYGRSLLGGEASMQDGSVFVTRIRSTIEGRPTFDAAAIGVPKQATLDALVAAFDASPRLSRGEACAAAGISDKTLSRYLKAMVVSGLLEPGPGKRSRYYDRRWQK